MICALLLGREGSSGFPGKNIYPVLGRPLAAYPMMVALSCPNVQRLYVSTDSPALKEIGLKLGARIIERPAHLASKQALGEHAYVHGYQVIRDLLAREREKLELLVLLFANAATVTPGIIEDGIRVLRAKPEVDSAVTVSCYNMWSPLRARKINGAGLLDPFVPFETFGDPKTMNCDRDSQGDVWFADMGVSIVRPHCLEHLDEGLLPQKWMGQKIWPLKQWGGLDVDEPWQIPSVEAWLQAHEVDRLFRVQRLSWSQLYDSERAVLSLLNLDARSRVLDVGNDPGGLGVALHERFGVSDYTAVVTSAEHRDEVVAVNPSARILMTSTAASGIGESGDFNVVAALRTDDDPNFFAGTLRRSFEQLAPGGSLVFTTRLTDGPTLEDAGTSYQVVTGPKGTSDRHAYVVRSPNDVMQMLRSLGAARIFAYGYSGRPSSTAVTPLKTVCFAVFAVTRGGFGAEADDPAVELRLPKQFLPAETRAR